MWNIIVRILLAIIAFVVINQYLQPLLVGLASPLGTIILIILYLIVLAWLLGVIPNPIKIGDEPKV